MTPIEDSITRDTDAILNALQRRFEAKPLDAELKGLFTSAKLAVSMIIPPDAQNATPEERAHYLAGIQARLDTLPTLFRNADNQARALRNLVICLHCVDRLLEAQYLDAEAANHMKGQVLGHYAVYAPLEPLH